MNNWGVYCKADISAAPLLLMEGSRERCLQNIADVTAQYESLPDYRVDKESQVCHMQITVTDMGSRAAYPTKFYFIAPKG